MAAPENLHRSEVVVASILHRLLETGLQRSELKFSDLGLGVELAPFFPVCADWLAREGVIAVAGKAKDGTLQDPAITARGFALLGRDFDLSGKLARLHAAVATVATEKRGLADVGGLIGGIMAGFAKELE